MIIIGDLNDVPEESAVCPYLVAGGLQLLDPVAARDDPTHLCADGKGGATGILTGLREPWILL